MVPPATLHAATMAITGNEIAIPYLRVSTDDRGQDPERQLEVIRPLWAAREEVTLLDAEIDEGASATKTNPFERPRFIAACERAKAGGATAIVVEVADRFCRQGAKEDGWAEIELRRRYGLRLLRADKPLDQHGTLVGDVGDALKAEVAREWVREHSKKVRSGMAKAKMDGGHVGRPARSSRPTSWHWSRRFALRARGGRSAGRIQGPGGVRRRRPRPTALRLTHAHPPVGYLTA